MQLLDRPRMLVRPLLAACFVAGVLLLGTSASELVPSIRLLGSVVGGVLIVSWIRAIRRRADLIDLATTAALLAFTISCVLSLFPRQAFDAATEALAWTSALGIGRRALATEPTRSYALFVMAAVGVVMGVVVIALWGQIWLRWLFLTGWQAIPPLDLSLPSGPWAHQHDLTSLLVMLAPAVWLQRGTGVRRTALTVVLLGIGLAAIMDGSRSVWLAVAVATAITLVRPLGSVLRRHWRLAAAAVAVGVVILIAATVSGSADEILKRLTQFRSIDQRTGQWSSALGLWLDHPVQGIGPGSFPLLLRLTDYFDTYTFVSRHPDNAFVQLVAEVGLLGIVSATAVVAGVVRMWRGDNSAARAAAWVLVYAAVASLGTNPFEYGFLIAPLIVWTALGAPARVDAAVDEAHPRRAKWLTPAIMSAAGVLALAQTATLVADFAYEGASHAASRGSYADARAFLDASVALDPGMALYMRERGTMALLAGLPAEAVADLTAAANQNPADDVSYRSLAEAWLAAGNPARALGAARSAVRRDASDPRNLLVLARAASRAGDSSSATEALARAVLTAPWITADPAWPSFAEGEPAADLFHAAVARWQKGEAPWLKGLEPAWLVGLAEEKGSVDQAVAEAGSMGPTAEALLQVLSCDTQRAGIAALRRLQRSQGSFGEYWRARIIGEALIGSRVDGVLAETATVRVGQLRYALADQIGETDIYSGDFKDQFGYRRRPIQHLGGLVAPSEWGGLAAWMNHPAAAASAAGMAEQVASC
jgi:O-antigen ligase/tetratricopeptide (TPR) repeat protein